MRLFAEGGDSGEGEGESEDNSEDGDRSDASEDAMDHGGGTINGQRSQRRYRLGHRKSSTNKSLQELVPNARHRTEVKKQKNVSDFPYLLLCGLSFCQRIVREVFKETYQVTADADFAFYISADLDDVQAFTQNGFGGPDEIYPWIDMRGKLGSPWNTRIVELLVLKLTRKTESTKLKLPENIWREAVIRKLYTIKSIWRDAQPQYDPKTGVKESSQEVEKRLAQRRVEELLIHRRRGRRDSVS